MTTKERTHTVRPDGQVAKPPAWLRIAGGNPHLTIVEGLSFLVRQGKGEGFDKLSPNGFHFSGER